MTLKPHTHFCLKDDKKKKFKQCSKPQVTAVIVVPEKIKLVHEQKNKIRTARDSTREKLRITSGIICTIFTYSASD